MVHGVDPIIRHANIESIEGLGMEVRRDIGAIDHDARYFT